MGASKVMIIRHAEKPVTDNHVKYRGINAQGQSDAPAQLKQSVAFYEGKALDALTK